MAIAVQGYAFVQESSRVCLVGHEGILSFWFFFPGTSSTYRERGFLLMATAPDFDE